MTYADCISPIVWVDPYCFDDEDIDEELKTIVWNITGHVELNEAFLEHMSKRHPFHTRFQTCFTCNSAATYYEYPTREPDFIYAACDNCWREHDKYNGIRPKGIGSTESPSA